MRVAAWSLVLLSGLAACGGDDGGGPSDTGPSTTSPTGTGTSPATGTPTGSGTGSVTSDTGPASDLCDPSQAPSTAVIAETQMGASYPSPAGGALVDGVYDLSRFEVYSPASADAHVRARRLVVAGDTLVSLNVDDGGPVEIVGGTWTASGPTLSIDLACPQVTSIDVPYTAAGDEVWLFDPTEPNVQVYTRR